MDGDSQAKEATAQAEAMTDEVVAEKGRLHTDRCAKEDVCSSNDAATVKAMPKGPEEAKASGFTLNVSFGHSER